MKLYKSVLLAIDPVLVIIWSALNGALYSDSLNSLIANKVWLFRVVLSHQPLCWKRHGNASPNKQLVLAMKAVMNQAVIGCTRQQKLCQSTLIIATLPDRSQLIIQNWCEFFVSSKFLLWSVLFHSKHSCKNVVNSSLSMVRVISHDVNWCIASPPLLNSIYFSLKYHSIQIPMERGVFYWSFIGSLIKSMQ